MTDSGNGDDKAAGASDIERHLMRAAADGRTATLAELGGSKAMTIEADRLSRSPLLPELARIFVAAGPDAADGVDRGDGLESLARIVLDGLNVAESPLAFTETLDVVLDSESVLKHLGEQVSAACLARVLQRRKYPALAGAALEGALRLVLGGWVPEYDLLGVLVRLRGPESHLFSRPALRCRWRPRSGVNERTGVGSPSRPASLRRKDPRPCLFEYRPLTVSATTSMSFSPRAVRCRRSWRRWPGWGPSC